MKKHNGYAVLSAGIRHDYRYEQIQKKTFLSIARSADRKI